MSKGTLGSFNGTTVPNENMVDVFRKQEIESHENSIVAFSDHLVLKKIGILCEAGTVVKINGSEIPIISGQFELAYGVLDIVSLVFDKAIPVNITYMY